MKLSVALTVAALLASTAAMAQQQPESPAGSTNSASQSSATESATTQSATTPQGGASANLAAIFDQMNTSHTGKLSKEEAQSQPTVAANFDAADTNKDGMLSKEEFLAAFKSQ